MRFLSTLLIAASTGLLSGALAATKIMPLGDSITGSPGCWRALLWQKLIAAGYTANDFDFVGTRAPDGCGFTFDGEHEGWGGYLATNIADQNLLVGWLASTTPDVVMVHLGTNDVWSAKAPSVILTAFSKLVDQMRASKPTMKILVAKIIPMNPPTCTECYQRTVDFNAAIEAWAPTKSTSTSPITVVDQWTGFNTSTDTYDGVHPNENGNVKLAAKWYPPLASILSGTTPPVTSTTKAPTSTTTSSTTTKPTSTSTSTTASATPTGAVVGAWGQCGGVNWTGGTTCVSGYTCKYSNAYYSQCLPN